MKENDHESIDYRWLPWGNCNGKPFKKINPSVEVIIIEQSSVLGYIGSSLNLYLEKYVEHLEDCRTTSPSELLTMGINVMINTKVTKIMPEKNKLRLV
ncbi:hypothetical protein ACFQOY_13490 [Enterococcus alcedinis]|uniref:hypothetical protein n=1 Tax=Enterococcus alcedinis TaxID=1274384 RepID=UPI0036192F8C